MEKSVTVTEVAKLRGSGDMLNEIFAFLPGADIVHKIRLLSKRVRDLVLASKAYGANWVIEIHTRSLLRGR